jgi:hypothetical protein
MYLVGLGSFWIPPNFAQTLPIHWADHHDVGFQIPKLHILRNTKHHKFLFLFLLFFGQSSLRVQIKRYRTLYELKMADMDTTLSN